MDGGRLIIPDQALKKSIDFFRSILGLAAGTHQYHVFASTSCASPCARSDPNDVRRLIVSKMGNGLTHIVDSLHPLPESQRAAALDQLLQDETVSTTLPRENSIKLTRCQVLQESSGCFRGPKLQMSKTSHVQSYRGPNFRVEKLQMSKPSQLQRFIVKNLIGPKLKIQS